MTQQLGVSRQTLWRLRRLRILREGHHWTRKTPFTSRVTGGLALAIGLRVHKSAAQQLAIGWRFTSRQPISSGATISAGRAKKDKGRCWMGEVVMAMVKKCWGG
jgi:hypothetical protein